MSTTLVDTALDTYVARMGRRGIDPSGVTARTLAAAAGCDTGEMSTMLQGYRLAQATPGATRYVLACQGYGRSARWRIMAKPSSDPKVVQAARVEQARYITQDAVQRYIRDRVHEVVAGLRATETDERLAHVTNLAVEQLEAVAKFVEAMLANGSDAA